SHPRGGEKPRRRKLATHPSCSTVASHSGRLRSRATSRGTARARRTQRAGWASALFLGTGRDRDPLRGLLVLVVLDVLPCRAVQMTKQHLLVVQRELGDCAR